MWHHAYHLPRGKNYGVNFGITLSLWDYLFGTDYIPHSGRDIKLGFPGMETFPKTFWTQVTFGFSTIKKRNNQSGSKNYDEKVAEEDKLVI